MLESQKTQIRMSELRQEYHTLAQKDELLDAESDRMTKIGDELVQLESRLQSSLKVEASETAAQATETRMDAERPETREFNDLYHRCTLSRYLDMIQQGNPLDGPEAEFRAAVYGEGKSQWGERSMPFHMLLPLDRSMEVRQDVATTIAEGTAVVTTQTILDRVFARGNAAFIGADFQSVGAGQVRYPYLSAGATLVYADESVDVPAAAGTITFADANPAEASLAYKWGLTSSLQFQGNALEAALRRDANMAANDGMDQTVLTGRAVSGSVLTKAITGLRGSLTAATAATADVTVALLMRAFASRIDGRYAFSWEDIRMLIRPEPYAVILEAAVAAGNESLANRLIEVGRLRATDKLPAPVSNLSDGISYAPAADTGNLKVPVWQDIGVIFDETTDANKREKRLTLYMAHNVEVLRKDPWVRHSFKDG